jgi:DNA-binding CsgD family transcriptional regulator
MLLLASQTLAPFTFTEALRLTRPKGEERWVFDLLAKYGIRDGFYCPAGHWMVAFWSKSVLKLSSSSRTNIYFVAQQAAFRLEELMGRRIRKIENIKPLTPRELAVVRGLRLGSKPMQIAADLGLSVPTVRTFLTRAMHKLEARTPEQAVGEAMARMLLR